MVAWEGSLSDEIPIRQGVRQGGKGSPLLYKVFINDLLKVLEEASYRLCVAETSLTCPTVQESIFLGVALRVFFEFRIFKLYFILIFDI